MGRRDVHVLLVSLLVGCGTSSNASDNDGGRPGDSSSIVTIAPASDGSGPDSSPPDDGGANPGDANQVDGPPHLVASCLIGDGGVSAVGLWENITPPQVSLDPNKKLPNSGVNYGTALFAVDPQNTAIVFLGTCDQGIYKTADCGATWTHVNTGRNGSMLDVGSNWTVVVDPVDDQIVYANSGYGPFGVFKSTNGGVDWDEVLKSGFPYAGFVETIAIDPTNHQHLVVSFHENCKNGASPGCLAETSDGGGTWQLVNGIWPAWGEASGQDILSASTWLYTDPPTGLYRTSDSGKTWKKVYTGYPNGGVLLGADGAYYHPNNFTGVLRSADDGVTWQAIPNSPASTYAIVEGDGILYTGAGGCAMLTQSFEPYNSAHAGDTSHWSSYPSPKFFAGPGRSAMAYDADHHLIYSSNCGGGFWRVATQ